MVSISNALEFLRDAKAKFYDIQGQGTSIKFEPENNEHTVEETLEQFERDVKRLPNGRFVVNYRPSKTSKTKDTITLQTYEVGFEPSLGVGNVFQPESSNSKIAELEKAMMEMRHQHQMENLKREYELKISTLKSKEDAPSGVGNFIGALGKIENILSMTQKTPSKVLSSIAGTSTSETSNNETNEMEHVLKRLHVIMKEDDQALINALKKLAVFGESNPAQFHATLSMI